MPQEKGYDQQTTPQAAAPMPLANADVYGAGLGATIEQAAGQRHQENLRDYQIERRLTQDREQTEVGHKSALHRSNMDDTINQLRTEPTATDPQKHVAAVMEANEAGNAAILDGITDEAVRNNTRRQLDAYGLSLKVQETTYAEGQRTAKMVNDFGQTKEVGANRILTQADAASVTKAYGEEMQGGFVMLDSLQNITPEVADKLELDMRQTYAIATLNRLNDLDPQAALALIDKGDFNNSGLTSAQLAAARNGAQIEIRRAEAKAQQAVAAERAQFNDDLQATQTKIGDGVASAASALPALREKAVKFGDNSALATIDGLIADAGFNQEYEDQTPIQRQERLNALLRVEKPSEAQQREIQWHQSTGKTLSEGFYTDSVQWMAEHAPANAKPPPLSAGLPARRDWANRNSAAFGVQLDFMSVNEAKGLRSRVNSGPQGQLEVANDLAELGGRDAIRAAQQVAPDDAMLRQLVTLPDSDRALVQNGAEVRRGNRAIVDGDNGVTARQLFNDNIGTALMLFPPAQINAAFEASRSIYANQAARTGELDYDDDNFEPFIERGLGARIGEYKDRKVLLPPNYTEDQFIAALNGYKPSGGENSPVLRNSQQALTAEQLRQFTPVMRPDGFYEFHGPGGVKVLNKRGTTFVIGFPEKAGK